MAYIGIFTIFKFFSKLYFIKISVFGSQKGIRKKGSIGLDKNKFIEKIEKIKGIQFNILIIIIALAFLSFYFYLCQLFKSGFVMTGFSFNDRLSLTTIIKERGKERWGLEKYIFIKIISKCTKQKYYLNNYLVSRGRGVKMREDDDG